MKGKYWALIIGLVIVGLIGWSFASKPSYEIKGVGFDDTPAQVVITEYSDFQCPACGAAFPILKQIKEEYSREQLKVDYKHFPLRQIHPFALKAGMAAECARDQNRFWEYHDKLFENQQTFRSDSFEAFASQLGLNMEEFNACLESNAMLSRVEGNMQEGIRAGVRATPTFFIAGKKYEGVISRDELKRIIDAELEK